MAECRLVPSLQPLSGLSNFPVRQTLTNLSGCGLRKNPPQADGHHGRRDLVFNPMHRLQCRYAEPDAPKFEDAISKLRKLEQALRQHPAVVLRKFKSLCRMTTNSLGQSEPPAEPTDFIQMLDSGVRLSDFLEAMNLSTEAGCAIGSGSSWGNLQRLD